MTDSPSPETLFATARQHLRKGEHTTAVPLLKKLVEQGFDSPKVLETLGVACSLAGHFDEAVQWLQDCLRKEPDRVSAFVNLGAICNRHGDYHNAVDWLNQALRLQWRSAEACYNLGIAYLKLKDHNQARTMLKEAVRLQPEMLEAWQNLGKVHLETGNHQLAASCFRKVLSIRPDHAKARTGLQMAEAGVVQVTRALDTQLISSLQEQAEQSRPPAPRAQRYSNYDLSTFNSCGLEIERAARQLRAWLDQYGTSMVSGMRKHVMNGIRHSRQFLEFRDDFKSRIEQARHLEAVLQTVIQRFREYQQSHGK